MTRSEFFVKLREGLLQLEDRALGAYMLRCASPWPPASRQEIPPQPSLTELYDRLFPDLSVEQANENVNTRPPDVRAMKRSAEYFLDSGTVKALEGSRKQRFESMLLALGQQTHDLLRGEPTMRWNVLEERRRRLEGEWTREDARATGAELFATRCRREANALRTRLDGVLEEQKSLSQEPKESPKVPIESPPGHLLASSTLEADVLRWEAAGIEALAWEPHRFTSAGRNRRAELTPWVAELRLFENELTVWVRRVVFTGSPL